MVNSLSLGSFARVNSTSLGRGILVIMYAFQTATKRKLINCKELHYFSDAFNVSPTFFYLSGPEVCSGFPRFLSFLHLQPGYNTLQMVLTRRLFGESLVFLQCSFPVIETLLVKTKFLSLFAPYCDKGNRSTHLALLNTPTMVSHGTRPSRMHEQSGQSDVWGKQGWAAMAPDCSSHGYCQPLLHHECCQGLPYLCNWGSG